MRCTNKLSILIISILSWSPSVILAQAIPPEIERYTAQKENKCLADGSGDSSAHRKPNWISFLDLNKFGKAAVVELIWTRCADAPSARGSGGFHIGVFKISANSVTLLFDRQSGEFKLSSDRRRLYLNLHGTFCGLKGEETCIGEVDFLKSTVRYHKLKEVSCKRRWSELCQFYLVDKDLL